MRNVGAVRTHTKRTIAASILLALFNAFSFSDLSSPGLKALAADEQENHQQSEEFSVTYTALTKQALLSGIELERFNLKYRLASIRQPKWRALRYSIAQEVGSGGILTFEVIGNKEFSVGRKDPAGVSTSALRGGLVQVIPTSAIASASSCFELGSNALIARKNRKVSFDPKSARESAIARFKRLDEILSQRELFVNAHRDHPSYARAVVEGQILKDLRNAEVAEFTNSLCNARGSAAAENTFYVLNAITNALGATAGGVAFKSITEPKLTLGANVLFILAGGFGALSPWVSARTAASAARKAKKSMSCLVDQTPALDLQHLAEHRARLNELLTESSGSLISSFPAVDRLALYTESNQRFKTQLESEISTSTHLSRVAAQQELLGPLIGGTLSTQGILGTIGYYKYATVPRKQFGLYYAGSIIGMAGASVGVAATATALFASWQYQQHLERKGQAPIQLIEDRLHFIDEAEKAVQAI